MPSIQVPLSLYVHIPWCVKKCPYCDFNSHAQRGALPVVEYVQALLADLDLDLLLLAAHADRRPLHSIFFGGGTPSLFAPDAIARILEGVASRMSLSADCEITLETNPGTVEHGRFEDYFKAGVNRISLGVQSFDDDKLRRLGRIHSSGEAERAVRLAQDAGYSNINLDLMYALPGQTLDGALADLERAIALAPAHLSHYQLTLEPNTEFASKPPRLPDEDSAWDMQEACQQRLAAAGYAQYEVSAYARAGRQCAHNLNYWRFGDYLGIGAGAHGKLSDRATGDITRTTKLHVPRSYLTRLGEEAGFGTRAEVPVAQRPFEFVLNALRLSAGVEAALFEASTGQPLSTIAGPLASARARRWLTDDETRLQPSESGQRFLNNLIELFMTEA